LIVPAPIVLSQPYRLAKYLFQRLFYNLETFLARGGPLHPDPGRYPSQILLNFSAGFLSFRRSGWSEG
jgi:hypothetical protein